MAEPPLESEPYGRWAERLAQPFAEACATAGVDGVEGADVAWFPQRIWGGRAYVPATVAITGGGELFGYVSYARAEEDGEPGEFEARAELATETAASNPDWLIDLSDEVI